jgi:uncharacterized protein YjbJ (UPF0337 family)
MNTTADDVLAKLGLQTRMGTRDYIWPALGIFGMGMLVGAGVVVMANPRMRDQIRDRLRRVPERMREMKDEAKERIEDAREQIKERVGNVAGGNGKSQQGEDFQAMSRDQLLERAKSMNLQTRANMTKQELIDAMGSGGAMSR